jgi:1-acyl-sn-glycerol-3-phosphate acyltransferase
VDERTAMFDKFLNYLFRLMIKIIVLITCDLEIIGFGNIPIKGGCIIASNHLGRLDALLVYHVIKRDDIILTVAEKYQKVAFFRLAVRALDGTWIDRYNTNHGALRTVLRRLKAGGILAIAPEGTRSETESLISGKQGAAFLGSKTQVPIIPVGITGTEDRIVKKNLKSLKKNRVKIQVGNLFSLPSLNPKNKNENLIDYTDEIMCRIAAQLPLKYHGVYANNPRLLELLLNNDHQVKNL